MTKKRKKWKPVYSGPTNSGICVCGHSWEDHHGNMSLNRDYVEATGENYLPGECEYYGFNEDGGLDAEGNYHCGAYKDMGKKLLDKAIKDIKKGRVSKVLDPYEDWSSAAHASAIETLKQAIRHLVAGQPTEALELINELDDGNDSTL